jgi:hypothetical protein
MNSFVQIRFRLLYQRIHDCDLTCLLANRSEKRIAFSLLGNIFKFFMLLHRIRLLENVYTEKIMLMTQVKSIWHLVNIFLPVRARSTGLENYCMGKITRVQYFPFDLKGKSVGAHIT